MSAENDSEGQVATAARDGRAMEGVRVLDLGTSVAGPLGPAYMAYHGADVIKIDTPDQPDVCRLFGASWANGRDDIEPKGAWLDLSPYVSEWSAGKRSVGLNMKNPKGRDALDRLIATCDVFVTNFSPRAVRSLGLTYESVSAVQPDIIYVSLPGFGSDTSGPYSDYLSFGPNQSPLVGIDYLTGTTDRPPAGASKVAISDYSSALHGFIATLAALEHRERTGEGTMIDVSQFEATVSMLGPLILEVDATGISRERSGNRSDAAAPEGVYQCRGEDRWIAISVVDDAAWSALVEVMGAPSWSTDRRYVTEAGRRADLDALDVGLGAWTADHDAFELTTMLQNAGVAAHVVSTVEELADDPQIKYRGWYRLAPSTRFGRDLFGGNPQNLTATPGRADAAGPILAEHTQDLLAELGYQPEEVAALAEEGAVYLPQQLDMTLRRPYDDYVDLILGVPGAWS
ncbi:CaiB/BaiF CoA transferase family protein [Nocardia vaccinii]|uniref:CaiB/BaiF CoA transferase family protein n=1 Tax=Nocardia vaccinii TaxID=1822 RepID=UPI0008332DC6|nr:CoA transferase [Nocardia vaccinii]